MIRWGDPRAARLHSLPAQSKLAWLQADGEPLLSVIATTRSAVLRH